MQTIYFPRPVSVSEEAPPSAECEKPFATKLHLKQHEGRHNKFTCDDCRTNYTTKVDFQAHVDIVHKGLPKISL